MKSKKRGMGHKAPKKVEVDAGPSRGTYSAGRYKASPDCKEFRDEFWAALLASLPNRGAAK
jgi:hypothetical protein